MKRKIVLNLNNNELIDNKIIAEDLGQYFDFSNCKTFAKLVRDKNNNSICNIVPLPELKNGDIISESFLAQYIYIKDGEDYKIIIKQKLLKKHEVLYTIVVEIED